MKQFVIVLLVLSMLFSLVPASADSFSDMTENAEELGLLVPSQRNAELDERFTTNDLKLVKATTPEIRMEDFEFPTDLQGAFDMEELSDSYQDLVSAWDDTTFTWLSFSKALNSGILLADDLPLAYYNGKYHLIYPSSSRGVADTNQNLAKYAHTRFQELLGVSGVVYSVDARYAGIYNANYVLQRTKFVIDPIIIDLSTGEMILTATYKSKLHENFAAVTTATFSSDEKYLYYMLYGNPTGFAYKTSLYRYNLETSETEFCYSGSDFTYYPSLTETPQGQFLLLRDEINFSESAGLFVISQENDTWFSHEYTFDSPIFRYNRLLSSPNSGYVLLPAYATSSSYVYQCTFQCIQSTSDFNGLNQYIVIASESNELQVLDADEITNHLRSWQDNGSSDNTYLFHNILQINISPDGYYALLLTRDLRTRSSHLFLMDLDNLQIKEIKGLDPSTICVGSQASKYQPVIEWNSDILLIYTTDGIEAYTFQ